MRSRADDAGPDEPVVGPSELVDKILALLEEAGAPVEVTDPVVKIIETWEFAREPAPPDWPDYS